MRHIGKILLCAPLALIGVEAQALSIAAPDPQDDCNLITDGSGWLTDPSAPAGWTGPVDCFTDPGNDSETFISNYTGEDVTLAYKNDNPDEEGSFAGNYSTTFANTESDPEDATISWDGGGASISCGDCWLVVKDGNQTPIWYLYDLQALGWDGQTDIILTGFWPDQGAISHVDIWSSGASVPAPGPLVVMAIGLMGMLGMRRMKKVI